MVIDEQLVELLMEAEDLLAQGCPVTAEKLCPETPELWMTLRHLLDGLGRVNSLLSPAPGLRRQDAIAVERSLDGN